MSNVLLTKLGVPADVQDFFQIYGSLSFQYGDVVEYFDEGMHKLPATKNLWLAGMETAPQVVVTYSAMEAIAFASLNRHHYRGLVQLAFIAIGSRLHDAQTSWIRQHFPKRKFTLVFGNDLLGHITAIKLAAGIRGFPVQVFHSGQRVCIRANKKEWTINDDQLSLHAFQETFGLRPRIRTAMPHGALTFLEQLCNPTH